MDVDQYKQSIRDFFNIQPVEAVYLYGSEAIGTPNNQSDIDIAVLFRNGINPKRRFDLRLNYIGFFSRLLGRNDVEVIDLDAVSLALQYSAVGPRKILFEKKRGNRRARFEAEVLSRYFDYRYYIRQNSLRGLSSMVKGF